MTNDEGNSNDEARAILQGLCFLFRHYFVIRHLISIVTRM